MENRLVFSERWKPVVGCEGAYEVSSRGRIKRVMASPGAVVGRILRQSISDRGYPVVSLRRAGRKYTARIHCIVAAAFLGPRPPGKEVHHIDGVKDNNHWTNLRYVTRSENVAHAFRSGLRTPKCGEGHGMAKLTEKEVRAIRRLAKTEHPIAIAVKFGVSRGNIDFIVKRKTWASVA